MYFYLVGAGFVQHSNKHNERTVSIYMESILSIIWPNVFLVMVDTDFFAAASIVVFVVVAPVFVVVVAFVAVIVIAIYDCIRYTVASSNLPGFSSYDVVSPICELLCSSNVVDGLMNLFFFHQFFPLFHHSLRFLIICYYLHVIFLIYVDLIYKIFFVRFFRVGAHSEQFFCFICSSFFCSCRM